mmetsp:Transcript_17245/g.50097  ORF Transcript_17245/g.50097 Transcript_17245/m.50097 type:complete len:259 (+) Transcript_17245:677-1453(+)
MAPPSRAWPAQRSWAGCPRASQILKTRSGGRSRSGLCASTPAACSLGRRRSWSSTSSRRASTASRRWRAWTTRASRTRMISHTRGCLAPGLERSDSCSCTKATMAGHISRCTGDQALPTNPTCTLLTEQTMGTARTVPSTTAKGAPRAAAAGSGGAGSAPRAKPRIATSASFARTRRRMAAQIHSADPAPPASPVSSLRLTRTLQPTLRTWPRTTPSRPGGPTRQPSHPRNEKAPLPSRAHPAAARREGRRGVFRYRV